MKVYVCMRYMVDGNGIARGAQVYSIHRTAKTAILHLEDEGYVEVDDNDYSFETNCVWRSKFRPYEHIEGGYFCCVEPIVVDD